MYLRKAVQCIRYLYDKLEWELSLISQSSRLFLRLFTENAQMLLEIRSSIERMRTAISNTQDLKNKISILLGVF